MGTDTTIVLRSDCNNFLLQNICISRDINLTNRRPGNLRVWQKHCLTTPLDSHYSCSPRRAASTRHTPCKRSPPRVRPVVVRPRKGLLFQFCCISLVLSGRRFGAPSAKRAFLRNPHSYDPGGSARKRCAGGGGTSLPGPDHSWHLLLREGTHTVLARIAPKPLMFSGRGRDPEKFFTRSLATFLRLDSSKTLVTLAR